MVLNFCILSKRLGIRLDKKIGTYLEGLPKIDTYIYYLATFLNAIAISIAISHGIRFIVLVGLASAILFYESYKMVESEL